jgi:hypothetical protein
VQGQVTGQAWACRWTSRWLMPPLQTLPHTSHMGSEGGFPVSDLR